MRSFLCYLDAIEKSAYEFASTQVNLPEELSAAVRRIAQDIRSEDLVSAVRTSHHITLKYGLHTANAEPVRAILTAEPSIHVRFGRTECFPASKHTDGDDVVVVKVFSPDLRRINARLKRLLPHTENHPQYQPHVTVARVKKGRGQRYADRNDLEGRTHTFNEVLFAQKGGRKTSISLRALKTAGDDPSVYGKPSWKTNVPAWLAAGGAGGALAGRYLAAPLLSRLLGLDRRAARRFFTLAGLGAGLTPGAVLGLSRKGVYGKFFHPGGAPQNPQEMMRFLRASLGRPRATRAPEEIKEGAADPMVYSEALWNPTFPVAQAMDEIATNPAIPGSHRVLMKQLVAQAGQEQGVGRTGLASAGALIKALPKVVVHAVPAAGGAWAVSKLLGAPRWLKNTNIGSALIYSALKSFMTKRSVATPDGYKLRRSERPSLKSYYVDTDDGKLAGAVRVMRGGNGKLTVGSLQVRKPHRRQGLAKYLLAVAEGEHKGKSLCLKVDAFSDRPLNNEQLTGFYGRQGYKPTGSGNELKKTASEPGQLYLRAMRAVTEQAMDPDFAVRIPMHNKDWSDGHCAWLKRMESERANKHFR